MGTETRVRPISERVRDFRLRWWGCDQDQVDPFVTLIAAARQQQQNGLPSLDALSANRQRERADEVVSMARRHADEIRAAAEHEAERILRDAERQAASFHGERLDASRRELDRMAVLRRDITSCLETAVSALEKVRELSAVQEESDASPLSSDSSTAVPTSPSTATEPVDEAPPSRDRPLYWIALVLWGVLMLSIVLIVSMPPAEGGPERAVVLDEPEQKQAVEDRGVPPAQVSALSTSQASGLTVTFIANRDCWISITTDEGTPSERLLKPSETITVRARDAVTLKVGNAAALSVLINDEPAAPLGVEGQVVTRRITRANYRTLLLSSSDQQTMVVAQGP